jgi:hypothetical protein
MGEEVRRSVVTKVELKDGARREVEQGSTALSYNPEFNMKTWEGSIW